MTEKKPMRGDVHPKTGKVFMGWDKRYPNNEYWSSPEAYERFRARDLRRRQSAALPETTLKRGDVHPETGKVFMNRSRTCTGGLFWVTPAHFEKIEAQRRGRIAQKVVPETQYRRGDVHPETGLLFWSSSKTSKSGMQWATQEQYDRYKAMIREWRKRSESRARIRKYVNGKRASDPIVALKARVRQRLAKIVSSRCVGKKSKRSLEVIGCSWEHLMGHIEKQFKPGMSWDNRMMWHIDHIIPIRLAKTEEDVVRLSHYTNLQPLWAAENLRKSGKILPT